MTSMSDLLRGVRVMTKASMRPSYRAMGPEEIIANVLHLPYIPEIGSVDVGYCEPFERRFKRLLGRSAPKADTVGEVLKLKVHAVMWRFLRKLLTKTDWACRKPELLVFMKRMRAFESISDDIDTLLNGLPCLRVQAGFSGPFPHNMIVLNRGEFYAFAHVSRTKIKFVYVEETSTSIFSDANLARKIERLWKRLDAAEAVI